MKAFTLIALLLATGLAGCGRPSPKSPSTRTEPAPDTKPVFPATDAELRAVLGSAATGLPSTNLTLRFADMAGDERLKAYLHELIAARSPDGIYHWRWHDDTGTSELNAVIMHQGRVTWNRLTNRNDVRLHEWLVHEVLRSEIVDTGSPQLRSTALRLHLDNGATQDVHYCTSFGP